MTRAMRARLVVFALISTLSIVAVSVKYLGVVDRVLGRGMLVTVQLPDSGGLYVSSEVTDRGVKVGKVIGMTPVSAGVEVKIRLDDDAKIPHDSPVFVHNGSAVGEQYLDFEPRNSEPPYLEDGDEVVAQAGALPVDEADLLLALNGFVKSVPQAPLRRVIGELGTTFTGTGPALRDALEGVNRFLDVATTKKRETASLLSTGRTVLRTQAARAGSIAGIARGLRDVSAALSGADKDVRTLLAGGPATFDEIRKLVEGIEPTLPILLSNLISTSQVFSVQLPATEQLLVVVPQMLLAGIAGTTSDGFGVTSLQFDQTPPCTAGFLPRDQWRSPADESDHDPYHGWCAAGPPINVRGPKWAPQPSGPRGRAPAFDPGAARQTDRNRERSVEAPTGVSGSGGPAWEWMLIGPTRGGR